jgi:hypothetical protein
MLYGGEISKNEEYRKLSSGRGMRITPTSHHSEKILEGNHYW